MTRRESRASPGPAGERAAVRPGCRAPQIVGASPAMRDVFEMVARVATTRSTVLIHGETGTGKELIARAIHAASPRADRPFVPVDCSALAEGVLESELFGHVRGAFTGAMLDKRGLFETADAGTCFLDEVGEISPCVQSKLLRVLQEHEIKRVGGTDSFGVDVRVIAATNRDLGSLIAGGRFREDLFYRLSVVTLQVPPLRERRDDIPLLAAYFLGKYAEASGRLVTAIAPEAMALLVAHDWPGNIRELEHAVERAVALTKSSIVRPEDLPPTCAQTIPAPGAHGSALSLSGVVTRHVRRVLREARWNKKLAAQLLGIHRRTLYRLTKRYGISLSEREPEGRARSTTEGRTRSAPEGRERGAPTE